jgi:hypothetical protein
VSIFRYHKDVNSGLNLIETGHLVIVLLDTSVIHVKNSMQILLLLYRDSIQHKILNFNTREHKGGTAIIHTCTVWL